MASQEVESPYGRRKRHPCAHKAARRPLGVRDWRRTWVSTSVISTKENAPGIRVTHDERPVGEKTLWVPLAFFSFLHTQGRIQIQIHFGFGTQVTY